MIQTDALTKRLGGRAIVSDVTFRCEPGTVTGFLGPNGAGKTTTMRMLVGLSEPDSGHAQVLGGGHRPPAHPRRRGRTPPRPSPPPPRARARATPAPSPPPTWGPAPRPRPPPGGPRPPRT